MTNIYTSIDQLIGNMPLFEIKNSSAHIYAKLEYFNATGSAKDRVAK